MQVMTSYFYQIRYFDKNMIPFSTAVWDPKWYHENRGQNHLFIDTRGIVNGLRIPMLVPPQWVRGACKGLDECPVKNPNECAFLFAYGDYVNTLKTDDVLKWLNNACEKIRLRTKFDEEAVAILMFHEKYDNPCSERIPVTNWLINNGVPVVEFSR